MTKTARRITEVAFQARTRCFFDSGVVTRDVRVKLLDGVVTGGVYVSHNGVFAAADVLGMSRAQIKRLQAMAGALS